MSVADVLMAFLAVLVPVGLFLGSWAVVFHLMYKDRLDRDASPEEYFGLRQKHPKVESEHGADPGRSPTDVR